MSDKDLDNIVLDPVKVFYETRLVDNSEFWVCYHKTSAFIIEELLLFSITQSQAFKRIIEGLDAQSNVLSNDHLKEILINSENKIL
ncbi:8629_t:CDS:2 [Racocetra fulgida]|uniref:8629_t:CDS:1 n=1 Tax=Racocetra fulgida TaxID=60492 RepID=A0A9N8WK11_9GLOM|nr:8629_t:CDS:2 [Racocetra fulgida]